MKKSVLVILMAFLMFLLSSTVTVPTSAWYADTHTGMSNEACKDTNPNGGHDESTIVSHSNCPDIMWSDGWDPIPHWSPRCAKKADHWILKMKNLCWKMKKWKHIWPCIDVKYPAPDYKARARCIGHGSHYIEDASQPLHTTPCVIHPDQRCHLAYESYVDDNWDAKFKSTADSAGVYWSITPSSAVGLIVARVAGYAGEMFEIIHRNLDGGFNPSGSDQSRIDSITRTCIKWGSRYLKGVYRYSAGCGIMPPDMIPGYLDVVKTFPKVLNGENVTVIHQIEFPNGTVIDMPITVFEGNLTTYVNPWVLNDGTVQEHPEMQPMVISIDPVDFDPGDTVTITAVILNWGAAVQGAEIELLVDDESIGSRSIDIDRFSGELTSGWTTTLEEGEHTLKIVADPQNLIDEKCGNATDFLYNEQNNMQEFTIGASPYSEGVGGVLVPVDKLGLLVPYIGLTSTILVATVVAIYTKRKLKHRDKENTPKTSSNSPLFFNYNKTVNICET